MAEPRTSRWRRRVKTIPAMLAITTAAILWLPVLVSLAIAVDVIRLRLRLPTLRLYLFVLQYLINDSVEIIAAPIYWAMAGFGTRLGSESSIARHERLQWWSVRLLERRAGQLLGFRVEIDDRDRSVLRGGPVVVIARHLSVFDASLPSLVLHPAGFRVGGVIMAELLADPGFDLIYSRLGSVFVVRDRGAEATAEIAAMVDRLGPTDDTALVIFPEGRLFREPVRDRLLTRLGQSDPVRAERLAGLTNLLPPRPGGLHTLLAAAPEADVVLIDHTGLERLRSLRDLASVVPIDWPIRVRLQRIARAEISDDLDGFTAWLDDLWLDLDQATRPA